jgi:hypothetical protein
VDTLLGEKQHQQLSNKACPGPSPAFMAVPIHVAVQELKTSLRVAGVTALCGVDLCSHGKLKGFSVYPKVLHFGII